MNLKNFGFIQGRLTKPPKKKILQYFPEKNWKSEFRLAKKTGFGFIEYFAEELMNKKNPIWSKKGLKNIKFLAKKNNLENYSFCDDFFIGNHILNYPNIEQYYYKLSKNLNFLKIKIYVLALFKKSEINKKNYSKFVLVLKKISRILFKKKIKLALETNLNYIVLNKLIKKIKSKNFSIVYDTGNRLKVGKLQYDEIIKLNKNIVHIHLKDKNFKREYT